MRLAIIIVVSALAAPAAGATAPGTSSGCPPGVHDPVVVLVATSLIHKGTLGSAILKKRMYAVASIRMRADSTSSCWAANISGVNPVFEPALTSAPRFTSSSTTAE